MDKNEIAERYGIGRKTVGNWEVKGVENGFPVPWGEPGAMVGWYETVFHGRKPPKKLREAIVRLLEVEGRDVPVGDVVVVDERKRGDLVRFAELLGLSTTVARVVEEEELSFNRYQAAMERAKSGELGVSVSSARKQWMEATESKRALSKADDSVGLASEVLKEWVRTEWEDGWRELRRALDGKAMGAELWDEVVDVSELGMPKDAFVRLFDKVLLRVLAGCGDEIVRMDELV